MSYRSLLAWAVFLLLGLGVVAHETTDIFQQQPPPKTGQLRMFTFSEPDLWRVEVLYQGQSAFFQRDDHGDWFGHNSSHTHSITDFHPTREFDGHHHTEQGASLEIAKQLGITARMIADRKLLPEEQELSHHHGTSTVQTVKRTDREANLCLEEHEDHNSQDTANGCLGLDTFGLENPEIIFSFYPRETDDTQSLKPLEVLYVGDMLPSKYTYYTMKDGDRDVYLVPRYFITMLLAVTFGKDQVPSPMPEK